jgi:hypothetical protein
MDMKSDNSIPEMSEATGFDRFFWGDLLTLRVLPGACALMWITGVVNLVLRW